MASLFFSYSHVDEALRDQLQIHLAGLQRMGLISSWHDRRIVAGSEIGAAIDAYLEAAEIILLLVSPDFIASDYCYDTEMKRAMEKHDANQARIIPIILRPCSWHDLPFGKLLAAPRDGKPVTMWPNRDEAFLNVVEAIKAALKTLNVQPSLVAAEVLGIQASNLLEPVIRTSNLRVRKQFSEYDLDQFRHQGFEYIAKFFENSLEELAKRYPELKQVFRRVDADSFTAAVYANGQKVCKGSASIGSGMMGRGSIAYTMNDVASSGSMNEALTAKSDDHQMYFEPLGMQSFGSRDKEKLSYQGAAEFFWEIFMKPLQ